MTFQLERDAAESSQSAQVTEQSVGKSHHVAALSRCRGAHMGTGDRGRARVCATAIVETPPARELD
jgi:hypothetical protein